MTLEQRVDKVFDDFAGGDMHLLCILRKRVLATLREAVEVERETCAKLAEDAISPFSSNVRDVRDLPAIIRQRKD